MSIRILGVKFMAILDRLDLPSDIKKLNINALKELAEELRAEILSTTSKNGGLLASNLGIIESTIALYYTFDFPRYDDAYYSIIADDFHVERCGLVLYAR